MSLFQLAGTTKSFFTFFLILALCFTNASLADPPPIQKNLDFDWALESKKYAHGLSSDTRLLGYLDGILSRLQRQTSLISQLKIEIVESENLTAQAAKTNTIFIYRGILRLTKTRSQIAGILAHELAHLENKDLRLGVPTTGNTLEKAVFLQQRQEMEFRADHLGMKIMQAAGFNTSEYVKLLDGLYRAGKDSSRKASAHQKFLGGTHPPTLERIKRAKRLIETQNWSQPDHEVQLDWLAKRDSQLSKTTDLNFRDALTRFDSRYQLFEPSSNWESLIKAAGGSHGSEVQPIQITAYLKELSNRNARQPFSAMNQNLVNIVNSATTLSELKDLSSRYLVLTVADAQVLAQAFLRISNPNVNVYAHDSYDQLFKSLKTSANWDFRPDLLMELNEGTHSSTKFLSILTRRHPTLDGLQKWHDRRSQKMLEMGFLAWMAENETVSLKPLKDFLLRKDKTAEDFKFTRSSNNGEKTPIVLKILRKYARSHHITLAKVLESGVLGSEVELDSATLEGLLELENFPLLKESSRDKWLNNRTPEKIMTVMQEFIDPESKVLPKNWPQPTKHEARVIDAFRNGLNNADQLNILSESLLHLAKRLEHTDEKMSLKLNTGDRNSRFLRSSTLDGLLDRIVASWFNLDHVEERFSSWFISRHLRYMPRERAAKLLAEVFLSAKIHKLQPQALFELFLEKGWVMREPVIKFLQGRKKLPPEMAEMIQNLKPLDLELNRFEILAVIRDQYPNEHIVKLGRLVRQQGVKLTFEVLVNGKEHLVSLTHPKASEMLPKDFSILRKMLAELQEKPDLRRAFQIDDFEDHRKKIGEIEPHSKVPKLTPSRGIIQGSRDFNLDREKLAHKLANEFLNKFKASGTVYLNLKAENFIVTQNGKIYPPKTDLKTLDLPKSQVRLILQLLSRITNPKLSAKDSAVISNYLSRLSRLSIHPSAKESKISVSEINQYFRQPGLLRSDILFQLLKKTGASKEVLYFANSLKSIETTARQIYPEFFFEPFLAGRSFAPFRKVLRAKMPMNHALGKAIKTYLKTFSLSMRSQKKLISKLSKLQNTRTPNVFSLTKILLSTPGLQPSEKGRIRESLAQVPDNKRGDTLFVLNQITTDEIHHRVKNSRFYRSSLSDTFDTLAYQAKNAAQGSVRIMTVLGEKASTKIAHSIHTVFTVAAMHMFTEYYYTGETNPKKAVLSLLDAPEFWISMQASQIGALIVPKKFTRLSSISPGMEKFAGVLQPMVQNLAVLVTWDIATAYATRAMQGLTKEGELLTMTEIFDDSRLLKRYIRNLFSVVADPKAASEIFPHLFKYRWLSAEFGTMLVGMSAGSRIGASLGSSAVVAGPQAGAIGRGLGGFIGAVGGAVGASIPGRKLDIWLMRRGIKEKREELRASLIEPSTGDFNTDYKKAGKGLQIMYDYESYREQLVGLLSSFYLKDLAIQVAEEAEQTQAEKDEAKKELDKKKSEILDLFKADQEMFQSILERKDIQKPLRDLVISLENDVVLGAGVIEAQFLQIETPKVTPAPEADSVGYQNLNRTK
jgi:hypothetical protein